jgi:NitT/TauT family transport system substrate-binding protein
MKNKLLAIMVVIIGLFLGGTIYFSVQNNNHSETTKVKIAYLANSVNALPLYLSIEKGSFSKSGLEVEAVKFEAPNQILDALISGQVDFGSPSTAMGITAITQSKNPNTLKIFALNGSQSPNNSDNALLIKSDSNISSIKELRGKKLGILPGIQFRTIAQHILDIEGLSIDKDVTLVELAIPLQLQALTTGQIDAVLTLEPVRSIGMDKKIVKDLVVDPINKYVADPWYGGGGVVSVNFAKANPNTTNKVISVFDEAIKEINSDPNNSRQYLKKYTPLNDEQIKLVPLPIWKSLSHIQESDLIALQRFLDIFTQQKIIENRIEVRQLLYSSK